MRTLATLWMLLLLVITATQIFPVFAVSKTYDLNVNGNTHYSVSVIIENPQLDSSFDVTVRLTLTSKDPSLDHTLTRWMQVILDSVDRPLHIESEQQNHTQILNTVGDSWQETFTFQISSSQYGIGKGQGIGISVIYKINIDEIDIPRQLTWNHQGDSTNNPLIITLSIPLLSTTELIIVLVFALIVIVIVSWCIYAIMKRLRIRKEERLRKEAETRRRENLLADNFECPFCHTLYDKRLEKCPHCGAPKKI